MSETHYIQKESKGRNINNTEYEVSSKNCMHDIKFCRLILQGDTLKICLSVS